ncbi:MAG: ABC transporter substrate-binding protein [Acidimicrobiales bacterium]
MSDRFDRRQFLRRGALTGGALLSLPAASALLAACGDDSSGGAATTVAGATTTAAKAGGATTKVGFQLGWKKLVQFGGHFMALDKGFFKAEGIDAEFVSGGPGIDPVADVAAGKVLLGDADGSGIVLAREKGIPVRAFAAIFQRSPFAVMSLKEKPVMSLKDMEGKKIGLPDGYRPQMTALLKAAGVDPSKVTFVPVGFDPAVLSTKQVDGYLGYATSQGVALQASGVAINVVYLADLGDKGYGNAFFATEKTLADQKDLLIKWLRADLKGWEYAVANPEEMAKRVVELYGKEAGSELAPETGSAKAQVELIKGNPKGLLWISPEVFDATSKFAVESGAAKKPISVAELMTEDILKGATGK